MTFDPRSVSVADLEGLSDAQFSEVVNADLRRRVRPEALPDDVARALREVHPERWRASLEGILRSVEGQLVTRNTDFELTQIERQRRLDQVIEPAQRDRITSEMADAQIEHLRWRTSSERFRTGVQEMLAIAEHACSKRRDAMFSTAVARERDSLAARVEALETAIRTHRDAILADLGADESVDPVDTSLWRVLAEPSVHAA